MDNEDVMSVWSEVVKDVKKSDICEMKSFASPPERVYVVMKAICFAVMEPLEPKKVDWKTCQKLMANPAALLERLLKYNAK